MIKVLVFPRDPNPYQELLYGDRPADIFITYLSGLTFSKLINLLLIPIELIYFKIKGFNIFHLHWLYTYHYSSNWRVVKIIADQLFYILLLSLKLLNYKLVWTIHNMEPHEDTFFNYKVIFNQLVKQAEQLIVLNTESRLKLNTLYPEYISKVNYIPLGNFINYYPVHSTKDHHSSFNILFIGLIKPYKGLEGLISEFSSIKHIKNINLKVVGKCESKQYWNLLSELSKNDKRITLINKFVENEILGSFFSWSDVVVLPFKKVTNSSSAMLAFSFKRPIIAPLIEAIKQFPPNTGYYYNPLLRGSLKNTILKAYKFRNVSQNLNTNAYKYAKQFDWKRISHSTYDLYRLLNTT